MDTNIKVAEIPASRGAAWIGQAWRLFIAAPAAWLGLCAGWLVVTLALVAVPYLGDVAANFMQPAFFASFAIAAHRQSGGERIVLSDLFSGFRSNLKSLVKLGAILYAAKFAIIMGMTLLGLPLLGSTETDPQLRMQELSDALEGREWVLLSGSALLMLVEGAFWFAPQLIAFHGMGTVQAARWSVYAAISNIGALLVYYFLVMAMTFTALLPIAWAVWLVPIGLLLAGALVAISSYTGYREIFEAAKPE